MLLFLLNYLIESGWKIPAAFFYSSTRMFLSALTALFCTLLLGPYFIKKLYEMKTGQSIRVENCPMLAQLHEKKKNTPTMGGTLILFSMLLSLFLWMDPTSSFTLILFFTTVFLGLLGAFDDYLKQKHKNSKGLNGKKKLFFQLLLGLCLALYAFVPEVSQKIACGSFFSPPTAKEEISLGKGKAETKVLSTKQYMERYYVPFYKEPIVLLSGGSIMVAILFTLFVVAGASNAVNLTDGLDGLAAGCVVMVSFVLGSVAFLSSHSQIAYYLHILYIEGSEEIAIYLFAMLGACLGFLWYNGYPAQVFMGDTGSLALGGILGVASILLRKEVLFAVAGGIFVVETLSVILQVGSYKLRNKKRVFLCTPLHHHFEYKGWPETKVVVRFWIVGFILALLAMASLKLQ